MSVSIRNRIIYSYIILGFLYAQIDKIPTQLLNNAGISKDQAKQIIQKELGIDLEKTPRPSEVQNDDNNNEIKEIIDSEATVNPKLGKTNVKESELNTSEVQTDSWNPPPTSVNNIDDIFYNYGGYIYKWNGSAWIVDSEINSRKQVNDEKNEQNIYFGYESFKTGPGMFTESNLGNVDPDYLIGPGDEIILLLWGQVEQNKPYIVTKDGYIFIEELV